MRRKYTASEIYEEIGPNLVSCWITSYLMGVLFLGSLASTILGGMGYDTILLVFSGLILIQAIRGIVKLRKLRARLQADPESVRMSEVLTAPSFKGIYAFVR
ncbi:hypothetical protein Mag101_08395 [Microbulbifer agarilyticus]|uniref:Uncharacterized protein n=1 Tax=Microbulbifer agarilyticus TaxID=260552 RepID=A0A1Q2M4K6_9GAMM|nr:hypothetical protein Mag101_08395 [Microbulbifer agarilyticus]